MPSHRLLNRYWRAGEPPISARFWILAIISGGVLNAGPTEDAILAAMRLSEQPNYSWIATVSDDARTYDIEGKTVRGGYTRITMPVINSVRRRLGRSVTDTHIEAIFRGNVSCVLETERGWMRPGELPSAPASTAESPRSSGRGGVAGTPGRRPTTTTSIPRRTRGPRPEERNYSNLQLAVSHPHEELGIIVSSHSEFVVDGDIVTGTLTDLGAQLLLVRDGQDEISPLQGTGTFKLWLHEGLVVRYHLRLEGTLVVKTAAGQRTIRVQQSSETRLRDVGTTTFEVPDQARLKLGRWNEPAN